MIILLVPVENRWTCPWTHVFTDTTSSCDSIGFRIHFIKLFKCSSVIPRDKRHFYPANRFWKNCKSLFIAEPRSDFNRCYEKQMSVNHNWILFIAVSLWFWSVAKYKRPIFKSFHSLHYWAGLNVLKVDCFWSCVPWTQATCLFCVPTIFVAYLDIITA